MRHVYRDYNNKIWKAIWTCKLQDIYRKHALGKKLIYDMDSNLKRTISVTDNL